MGNLKGWSMVGFDLLTLYDVNKFEVGGGDWIVVSEVNYYIKWELFERWEAGAVIAHAVWCSGINDALQSRGGGRGGGESKID